MGDEASYKVEERVKVLCELRRVQEESLVSVRAKMGL